ncbi:phosphotransferase [Photobacterium sp. DNB23_23_1]|uniref:Aminoglycoside phosphotransferase family protein n=1 Tax=Photobacterium pectinilyticum TaxID=2906793 RepID=A0ABT1N555_9GAMM|nr:aminoglycoside phosphotransferase family protein [Photobacterium sp. ZSDE20]MCQ1059857.1 aminoglycoside phosphotransferase family protein [Photobacterium sp. ZSDE20]MDD1826450.1 aminoglycoside phosphotransferase family protein [Photobacterium sp. ZSDE20]
MEELQGGREGHIFRSDNKIYRPRGKWSETVQFLLSHIAEHGFNSAPKPYGFDGKNNEILSYVEGDVFNYPLKGNIATTEALTSAAKLLRLYHDASSSFLSKHSNQPMKWMLPSREPTEVICHGDYAPYNVSLMGSETVGIIDFDTAHPAPRTWDIAYALYCWAPFKTHEYDAMGDLASQSIRAKQFCDAYGLLDVDRLGLVNAMIDRIQALVDHMHNEVSNGNQAFIENINDGHHLAYLTDINYLSSHQQYIIDALVS